MSKNKHKRKQQRAEQKAPERAARAMLMREKKMTDNKVEATAKTTDKTTHDAKASRWKSFKEYVARNSSFTDWCIAAFTFALASAATYQFVITNSQLSVMRNDERAWLIVGAKPDTQGSDTTAIQFIAGQPVNYPLEVKNVGKTPASNVEMKVFVDILNASTEVPLDHVEDGNAYPYGSITSGIIFPNGDFKQLIMRPAKDGTALVATSEEVNGITNGTVYLAVYGVITYDDVFHVHHWTRFCNWISDKGTFATRGCTQYNTVDDK